jgi:methylmalonyl-CoA/ethylmalonyl-CoA epimerase
MPTFPIHHIGIAVESIDSAAPLYELLSGERCSPVEEIGSQGVRVAFVGQVELLEPTGPDTTVARFLARRGPGLHHIAYHVEDLAAELARLASQGMELIDREPRAGAGGHRVAFLHPRSTGGILVELVEDHGPSDGDPLSDPR